MDEEENGGGGGGGGDTAREAERGGGGRGGLKRRQSCGDATPGICNPSRPRYSVRPSTPLERKDEFAAASPRGN